MAEERFVRLLDEALTIQSNEDTGLNTVNEVTSILNTATKLVESSGRTYIAVFDAKVLSVSTNVLTNCVLSIDANLNAFDVNLFAASILSYITVETPAAEAMKDWTQLHEFTDASCKHTASLDYMLGTFTSREMQPKARKERARRQVEAHGPVVKPQNVIVGEKHEDGIEESLHIIMKVLLSMYRRNENKPICYFKLVIDPQSFSASVENIYHVSFLVKDGVVKFTLDSDGFPLISPTAKQPAISGEKKLQGSEHDSNQCVISLNMDMWKQIVEAFEITRARIPSRDKSTTTAKQSHS